MPSSVMFGSRPRIFLIRSYSSGVIPCLAMSAGVMATSVFISRMNPTEKFVKLLSEVYHVPYGEESLSFNLTCIQQFIAAVTSSKTPQMAWTSSKPVQARTSFSGIG